MSKIENNSAKGQYRDDWDKFVKEHMTPEEIVEMDFHVALTWALCEARDEGKITVEELQEIEDIEEPAIWLETVVKRLISLGKTLKVVPIAQEERAEQSKEVVPIEQNNEVVPMEQNIAS